MMKTAILLVAYGPCSAQARLALANFERLCKLRFPHWPVRWAYTSPFLRERLLAEKSKSDSVAKALSRLRWEKFEAVVIQPLQTIAGHEHEQMLEQIRETENQTGLLCAVGAPLLAPEENLGNVAKALMTHIPAKREIGENALFMGHGARHPSGSMYVALDQAVHGLDARARVGVMNGPLNLDALLPVLDPGPVWLVPLLSTIGRHVSRDMAGQQPESWRSRIEAAGHPCRPVLAGMVESPGLAAIWLEHLDTAARKLLAL